MIDTITNESLFRMLVYISDANNSAELGGFMNRFHTSVDGPVFRLGYVHYTENSAGAFAHMTNQGQAWLMNESRRRADQALADFRREEELRFQERAQKLSRTCAWCTIIISTVVSIIGILIDILFFH